MKKIIAFSGINSLKSINQQLITIISNMVEGLEVEILNLREYPAPMYGVDEEEEDGFPESMMKLQKKMESADGFIISSPEHNGSMPAVLKNTIDWLSEWAERFLMISQQFFFTTSPGGRGGLSALNHLLAIMPHQGAQVIGGHAVGSFFDKVKDGELIDGEDKSRIKELIAQL